MTNEIDDIGGGDDGEGELTFNPGDVFPKLLNALVEMFAESHGLAAEGLSTVPPGALLSWLRDEANRPDSAAVCERAGVDNDEALPVLLTALGGPHAFGLLEPALVAAYTKGRPALTAAVSRVVMSTLIHFDDNSTLVLNTSVASEAVSARIDDALLIAIVRELGVSLRDVFAGAPLEELRQQKAAHIGGEATYQAFMGLVLRSIRELPEPHRTQFMGWFRVAQQLIFPFTPPSVRAAVNALREKYDKAASGAPADDREGGRPPRGSGWDED